MSTPGKPHKPLYKKVLRILCSKLGILLILAVYCSAGAFLFAAIESKQYDIAVQGVNKTQQIIALKNDMPRQIIEAIASYTGPNDTSRYVGFMRVKSILDDYQQEVINAIQQYDYTGVLIDNGTSVPNKWNFLSGMLFCFTTITTVGYGHVVPVSEVGRFVLIVYALIGVPMSLIFLAEVGSLFANALRAIYFHLCCCAFNRKRKQVQLRYTDQELKQANTPKPIMRNGTMIDIPTISILPDEMDNVPSLMIVLVMIAYLALGAGIFTFLEKWPYYSSYYYSFVSLVTIGFGDYVPGIHNPNATLGKISILVAVAYITLGLAILGMGINIIVSQFIFKYRSIGRKIGVMEAEDKDGDGKDDGDERALAGLRTLGRAF